MERPIIDGDNPVHEITIHPREFLSTTGPIVNEYREGKVKRTPGGE